MRYAVIIPVHNEAENLFSLVSEFIARLPASVSNVLGEIILVENGSTDRTAEVAKAVQARYPALVRLLSLPRGSYGAAIKYGMEESVCTHLSILECDFLDAGFVGASIALFNEGRAEFIVASKRHPHSVDRRPRKRRLMTVGFNLLLRALVGFRGSDTHGLKSIESGVARHLCRTAMTTDEVFQSEIVLLAWRLGHAVVELPIEIAELRPAPVSISRRVPKVLPVLWQLRRSLRRFPKRTR